MKVTRKILPALAMLIVSAVMLSTASFAWFAMGTSVSANNMSVGIKSDSSFLMIADSANVDTTSNDTILSSIRTAKSTYVNYTGDTELFPIAFDESIVGTSDGTNAIDDFDLTSGSKPWYYMRSTDPSNATGSGDKTYIDTLTEYVLHKTVYLAIAAGSNAMTDLTATVSGTGAIDEAVRVLVVVGDVYYVYDSDTLNSSTDFGDITSSAPVRADIYVYYDGNDASVTTNNYNAASIADTIVNVTFSATVSNN